MLDMDIDQLADAIIRRMRDENHAVWIDSETHSNQHEFLKMMMNERTENIARRKRIEEKIAGSAILSSLLLLVGLIGAGVLNYLRENLR